MRRFASISAAVSPVRDTAASYSRWSPAGSGRIPPLALIAVPPLAGAGVTAGASLASGDSLTRCKAPPAVYGLPACL